MKVGGVESKKKKEEKRNDRGDVGRRERGSVERGRRKQEDRRS